MFAGLALCLFGVAVLRCLLEYRLFGFILPLLVAVWLIVLLGDVVFWCCAAICLLCAC